MKKSEINRIQIQNMNQSMVLLETDWSPKYVLQEKKLSRESKLLYLPTACIMQVMFGGGDFRPYYAHLCEKGHMVHFMAICSQTLLHRDKIMSFRGQNGWWWSQQRNIKKILHKYICIRSQPRDTQPNILHEYLNGVYFKNAHVFSFMTE